MSMLAIAVVLLLIFIAIGVPVCFAIGLSGLCAVAFGGDAPLFMVVQQIVRGLNSFPLMACPFFILAGEIMGAAKLSDRILDFCRACVSWMKGGLGAVCVLANMIFAAISGSGAASISAIGSLTTPQLKKTGYNRGFVAALIAGGGALGPIIPPSMNMIIYGSLTGDSVGKLFLGGVLPGILIGGAMMLMCFYYAKKHHVDQGTGTFSIKDLLITLRKSFFALITPLIIIGGVISGVFTPTEAGIVACVYGLICGFFIYRTIKVKELLSIFRRATESSAMIMMIMGIATIYSYIFAVENVGDMISNFLLSISTNPIIIMLIITVIMMIIGCFMETIAAMVVLLPVIYPVVMGLGVDPVQFGVLFCISTVLGGVTPPVGVYLFLSMSIAGANIKEVARYIIPIVIFIVTTMILIIFIPGVATLVPNVLMR
ncbi:MULTISPECIES: TRAP transporter large permease [Anaerotruncus]|jgi:tripartite ATP-independent transporter DctM subunit|uniref:TRAP transporter large permease n=1 Tax=Anaerotruncus TaxID=244127 RepID=UPI001FA94183|nr:MULTISPECIES: TRAP transporter large permease [Anaerotruncus]